MSPIPRPMQDWDDPYALPPRPMTPGVSVATMPGASDYGGFQPGQDTSWGQWWRTPLPDAAFNPQVTSSGVTGMGNSAQPESSTRMQGPSAAAGELMNGAKEPPPPVPAALSQSSPSPQTSPDVAAPPPPLAQRVPPPAGAAPAEQTPIQRAIKRDTETLAQPAPQPGNNWAQRLGMAVLSATKLAPYAQQIIHPKWSQEMASRVAAEKELTGLVGAQETQQRGDWYAQQAAENKGRYLRIGTGVFDQQDGKWVTMPMDKSNLVSIDPKLAKERGLAPLDDGTFRVPSAVAAQFVKPGKDPGGMYVDEATGTKLGIVPDVGEDGNKLYYLPPQGIGPHVTNTEKPPSAPTAEAQKIAQQNAIAKMEMGGEHIPPAAFSDQSKLVTAIRASKVLTDQEKAAAIGFQGVNPTPASTGTAATIRVEGMLQSRENPVINKRTGELELRSSDWVNSHPGLYMPAGQGASAMSKDALFQDLHYNIQTARNAINALDELNAPTRAALSFALRDTDTKSAMQTFLAGALGTQLTPQQQEAVQALALLNENAMSLRSLGGMGQGSEEMRSAIRATLPGGKSASKGYAIKQLEKFENVVNRLERGVPGTGAQGRNPPEGSGVDRAKEILFGPRK